MSVSDDRLAAYADGELDEPLCGEVAAEVAADPALAARVRQLRQQRQRVAAAFAAVLEEPVPTALRRALEPPSAQVVELASRRRPMSWAAWGGMAASLVFGVLLGAQLTRAPGVGIEARDGGLVASGAIEQALSRGLASEAGGEVALAISFIDRSGRYCRTFGTPTLAGLACRQQDHWSVQALSSVQQPDAASPMRRAASALPLSVLQAVDASIVGAALDAAAERRARDAGWRR